MCVRIDPANPARGELEGRSSHRRPTPSTPSRVAGRQGHCHLHEGRGVESVRSQPGGRARERRSTCRAWAAPAGSAGNMDDTSLFYTFTVVRPTRPRSSATTSRRGRVRCSARRTIPGLDVEPVRHQASVRHQQGRRESADVPGAQERPGARRQQSDADVRLRRLQHRDHPGLQLAAHCAARAGVSCMRASTCAAAANTAKPGTTPAPS